MNSGTKIRRGSPGASRPTSTSTTKQPIDILYGSDRLRRTLDENGNVTALVDSWRADEDRFRRQRQPHLLY